MSAHRVGEFVAAFRPLVQEICDPELGSHVEELRCPQAGDHVIEGPRERRGIGGLRIGWCGHDLPPYTAVYVLLIFGCLTPGVSAAQPRALIKARPEGAGLDQPL